MSAKLFFAGSVIILGDGQPLGVVADTLSHPVATRLRVALFWVSAMPNVGNLEIKESEQPSAADEVTLSPLDREFMAKLNQPIEDNLGDEAWIFRSLQTRWQ